jgi:hypothetical protein
MTTPSITPGDSEPEPTYIAIIDVSDAAAQSVLEELTREGISAYAEPVTSTPPDGAPTPEDLPRQMRIHVEHSRIPAARAIITSRFPQIGADFLSRRDREESTLTTEQVDEAWAQLILGMTPEAADPHPHRPGRGSGLSDRLIRRHQPSDEDPLPPGEVSQRADRADVPVGAGGPRDYALDHDLLDDDEDARFIPPEPPPLPRPQHTADKVGWAAVIGGPALLVANQILTWGTWISGVGVAAFMGGFILLVARMRGERDHDDPGAVV